MARNKRKVWGVIWLIGPITLIVLTIAVAGALSWLVGSNPGSSLAAVSTVVNKLLPIIIVALVLLFIAGLFIGVILLIKSGNAEEEGPMDSSKTYYASIGNRFAAYIVQHLIYILFMVIGIIVDLFSGIQFPVFMVLGIALVLFLQIYLVATRSQGIGMWLFNMQVVDRKTGMPMGTGRYILMRMLVGQFVLYFVPLYSFVDALFILRKDRRTLHDMMSAGVVVRLPLDRCKRSFFDTTPLRDYSYDPSTYSSEGSGSGAVVVVVLASFVAVLAVIGVLASIVLVGLGGTREKARDSKALSDHGVVQVALGLYHDDNGEYPNELADLFVDGYLANSVTSRTVFLYALSPDGRQYHLGVQLESAGMEKAENNTGVLGDDQDFDSRPFGGFDGSMTGLYDVVGGEI